MRFRTDPLLVLCVALSVNVALAAAQPEQTGRPHQTEISRAIESVKADPNLTPETTIKTLKWKEDDKPRKTDTPWWLAWVAGFFRWFAQSTRVLVWITLIVLAGLLVVYMTRMVRARTGPVADESFVAPTHVRDLDIRPESLPDDLGSAAQALWDRGEHRASLALLYRGMLSRLAHVHKVPIRDSSTEGDCLVLAERHLTQSRQEYASRLVGVWQRFVYAGQDIDSGTVHVLCAGFAAALDGSTGGTA